MFTISYEPLWSLLRGRGLKKIDLVRQFGLSPSALKKLEKGEPVSLNVLGTICVRFGVGPESVVEFRAL